MENRAPSKVGRRAVECIQVYPHCQETRCLFLC